MEVAVQYIKQSNLQSHSGIIYIFSDCKNAIEIVTNKTEFNRHSEIFEKVQQISRQLYQISYGVTVLKIPGHYGIHGNILADQKAKELAQMIVNKKISAPKMISVSDAQQIATQIAKRSWQHKWNEDSKGRSTYELIPVVGTKILWPKTRDIRISYVRMLLHDTMLNKDSHRTGTSDTAICDCGEEEETVMHMLLHCIKHAQARVKLSDVLEDIWTSLKKKGSANDKVMMLLAPPLDDKVSRIDNLILKNALFQFISDIDKKL